MNSYLWEKIMIPSIIVAMESELASLHAVGIDAVCSGIGKVNAAVSATKLILESKPDCIISTGVAGGMHPSLRVGDIVIGEQVAYHDVWCGEGNLPGQVQGCPRFFDADPHLLSAAREAAKGAGKGSIGERKFGLIASGDQFYLGESEDARILSILPDVLAADMESAAIAQVCHRFGVPFLSIRVISDVHTSASVQKESYGNFRAGAYSESFEFLKKIISLI